MDALYLIERDFGKLGLEAHAYRERTRADVIGLCALEYFGTVKTVLEIREDEHSVSDITEEILAEAEQMRSEYHRNEVVRKSFWQHREAAE